MGKPIIDTSSVTRVGLDLAKRVLRIHAVDATGSGRGVAREPCAAQSIDDKARIMFVMEQKNIYMSVIKCIDEETTCQHN